MGYIRHNVIVVTGMSYTEAQNDLELVYKKAIELFEDLVTPVVKGKINGYQSFFIAPDGSKEDWDMSDGYDEKRKELSDYIDSLAYEDGSNSIHFLDVGFDESYAANIDRTNKCE